MTHLYTLLVGGTVIPGGVDPVASAIAWAEDTILLIGTDEDVLGISRGDSHLFHLDGASVVPLGPNPELTWPSDTTLQVGGRADLAVLERDPRIEANDRVPTALALVRGGQVVAGNLPGAAPNSDDAGHHMTAGQVARHEEP